MAPASLILSRRDLEFLLHEWLDVSSLTSRERFAEHSRETFDAVLELGETIATEHFAPHNKKADAHEPYVGPDGTVVLIPEVKRSLEVFVEAGLMAGQMDESLGGLQLPNVVSKAVQMWFHGANVGSTIYPFLTMANANLVVAHGTPEQVQRYVTPMLAGEATGTMCLSEPGAGSSLADITTRAERQDDGSYRITGTKMWISGGDHELTPNIVHLVLAKIPGGPAGVKGISLFLVPKVLVDDAGALGERNDVALVGLNHKMGYRGGTNTLLNFGEGAHTPGGRAGAVGELLGQEHHGLAYMFHMMNEARVGVGLGATALGYTGYLKSLDYARTRTQGRLPGDKDPSSPPVAIIAHADVRRMLLAQKSYVEGGLALGLYCSLLVDEQDTALEPADRERAALLLDVLTPIAKSWPSQWCLEANSLAIQVHGGYGYTRDYDVEQHYRDNRLNPIHEGTHGIHGLDLLGRKMTMRGGAGLTLLLDTVAATIDRAASAGGELAELGVQLQAVWERIGKTTATVLGVGDPNVSLANATVYLEAVGHAVVAWMWLEQLLAADGKDGAFYDGKRHAGRFFYRWELPRTGPQLDLLDSLDTTLLDTDPAWF